MRSALAISDRAVIAERIRADPERVEVSARGGRFCR
jgi:hypothetical protein